MRAADPDVITGWNVVDFDLAVLLAACRRAGLRFAIGRTDDEFDLQRDQSFTRESRAVLSGRLVLDGLSLMRGAFIRLDDYKLETAAQTLLGKGKLIAGDAPRRGDRSRVPRRPAAARRLQPARTPGWCSRCSTAPGWSSWPSSAACSPACSSTA